MAKRGRAWVLYALAAALVLCATAMFLASQNYVCSSTDSGADSSCGNLTVADLVVHAIVAAIGLGFGIYLIVKAVRSTRPR